MFLSASSQLNLVYISAPALILHDRTSPGYDFHSFNRRETQRVVDVEMHTHTTADPHQFHPQRRNGRHGDERYEEERIGARRSGRR